jgi:hypothetical protein
MVNPGVALVIKYINTMDDTCATTFSITTLSTVTFSIMTFSTIKSKTEGEGSVELTSSLR